MRISDWSSDVCSSDLKFDWISALLNAVAFGFLITGAESVAKEGLAAGLAKLAVGLAAGALLVRRELRREAPLVPFRSDEHTSELQSLMRISYAVFCLKTKTKHNTTLIH